MNTREALEVIARRLPPHTSIICSLGRTSEEVFKFFPDQTLFLDSMGDVSAVALGVALGVGPDEPVVAFDTDGSFLLGLALLPTLAGQVLAGKLSNFLLIVFDNELFESGGGGPSRIVALDWAALGKAFGLNFEMVNTREELENSLVNAFERFNFKVVKINNPEPVRDAQKTMDGIESRYRFIRHLENSLQKQLLKPAIKS